MNEDIDMAPEIKGHFLAGRRAWKQSKPIDRNPFPATSQAGKAWEAGWMRCEDEERERG